MQSLLLTIAIPTIGDNDFLEQAVRSALNTLPLEAEIIICDNASENPVDVNAMMALDPLNRIKCLRYNDRISMALNWNRCLSQARGEFFLLLSDDDIVKPDYCASMIQLLKDPEVGAASCGLEFIDETSSVFWSVSPSIPFESPAAALLAIFRRKRVLLPCATMLRTLDLRKIGGYDSDFGNWADMKAWLEVSSSYSKIAYDPRKLAQYRERPQSLTKTVNDVAWRDSISKTVKLAGDLFPSQSQEILEKGHFYLEYILADIQLKRVVSTPKLWFLCIPAIWSLSASLSVQFRLWLLAKFIYLRSRRLHVK